MEFRKTILLNAPPAEVFGLLEEPEKMKLWMDGLEEIAPISGQQGSSPVGSRYRLKIREGGRIAEYESEVTVYEKPGRIALRLGGGPFSMEMDYRFGAADGGTRLDYTCTVETYSWFAAIMARLFGWLTRRIVNKQLAKLKEVAEASPSQAGV